MKVCIRPALFISLVLLLGWVKPAMAQFNLPMINQYYTNPYLWNPAQAGGYDYPVVYLTYKDQWTNVQGHPTVASFTANMPVFNSSGIGINVYNDQSGFLSSTKAVLSFSQTVFINAEHQYISFGISAGIINQHINLNQVSGETGKPVDPIALGYNSNQPVYPDADFGIAYRLYGLDADIVLPNLIKYSSYTKALSQSFSGLPLFFSSVGYNFDLGDNWGFHPKVAFRKIDGIGNEYDVSGLLTYRGAVSLGAFYHSDKTFSVSLGFMINKSLDLNYAYTQSNASLQQYFGNTHEFSIGYHFYSGRDSHSSKNLLIRCPQPVE